MDCVAPPRRRRGGRRNSSVTSRCGSPLLLLTCALLMTSWHSHRPNKTKLGRCSSSPGRACYSACNPSDQTGSTWYVRASVGFVSEGAALCLATYARMLSQRLQPRLSLPCCSLQNGNGKNRTNPLYESYCTPCLHPIFP